MLGHRLLPSPGVEAGRAWEEGPGSGGGVSSQLLERTRVGLLQFHLWHAPCRPWLPDGRARLYPNSGLHAGRKPQRLRPLLVFLVPNSENVGINIFLIKSHITSWLIARLHGDGLGTHWAKSLQASVFKEQVRGPP